MDSLGLMSYLINASLPRFNMEIHSINGEALEVSAGKSVSKTFTLPRKPDLLYIYTSSDSWFPMAPEVSKVNFTYTTAALTNKTSWNGNVSVTITIVSTEKETSWSVNPRAYFIILTKA